MRYQDAILHARVRHQPAIRATRELGFRSIAELGVGLDPSHHLSERPNDVRIIRRGKRGAEWSVYPIRKCVLATLQFLLYTVNTLNLARLGMTDERLPESRRDVERVVAARGLDEHISIEHVGAHRAPSTPTEAA